MKVHVKNTFMLLIYFFIAVCLLPLFDIPSRIVSKRIEELPDGWELVFDGRTYLNATLNDFAASDVPTLNRGEKLTFSKALYPEKEYEKIALLLCSQSAAVRVFLNGQLVYFDENSSDGSGVFYQGKGYHLVDLPDNLADGAVVTVEYTAMEDYAFSGIYPPKLGSAFDLIKSMVAGELRPLVIGAFMCTYGALFVFISVFFSKNFPQIQGQIYAAMLCVLIGVWLVTSSNMFLYLYPASNTAFMQYLTQFLVVPVFYLLLSKLQVVNTSAFDRIYATVISMVSMVCFTVWSFNRNYTTLLLLAYIPFLLLGLFVCVRYYYQAAKSRSIDYSVHMQVHGLTSLLIACLIHCIIFYVQDVRGISRDFFGRNVMSLGVSMLTISQMINFFFCMTRNMAEQKDYLPVEELAYRDLLTGLPNRAGMEEALEKAAKSKDNYAFIMMDINGLKKVNDGQGHVTGDHLLQEFAQVLKTRVRGGAFYARVGGDEFAILIEKPRPNQPQELIDQIRSDFDEFNRKESTMIHSFAAGYASSDEVKTQTLTDGAEISKRVFNMADSRMYQQKSIMKRMSESLQRADS